MSSALDGPRFDESTDQAAAVEPARTVEGFLDALHRSDLDALAALTDEHIVYDNVGWPTIHGRNRMLDAFRGMVQRNGCINVKIHRIATEGSAVITERTDAVIFGRFRIQFWVCGVFEVQDGQVTLWRDYFDLFDVLKATARGVLAMAVPSLRQRF